MTVPVVPSKPFNPVPPKPVVSDSDLAKFERERDEKAAKEDAKAPVIEVPATGPVDKKVDKKITFAGQKTVEEQNAILNGLFSVVGGYVDSKHKGEVLSGWRHVLGY